MNVLWRWHIIFLLETSLKHVSSQTTYRCSVNSSCGCSSRSAVLTKIVGGETAATQTWGWIASLRYSSTNSHFCAGTIISSLHILTGAHCINGLQSASLIRVYVGSIYLSESIQVRDVSIIRAHPNYSTTTFANDLAILKLSSSLDLTRSGVNIVCLPNVSSIVLASQEYPAPDTNLVAIGWGYLQEGAGSVSPTLQQVTIQSVAAGSIYCENVKLVDPSTQFCAGTMPEGQKDTCQGDSGGPLLMFTSNNVWEQVGITSNGIGCARAELPGIYTRVAAYQKWINDTMNNGNSFDVGVHLILTFIIAHVLF